MKSSKMLIYFFVILLLVWTLAPLYWLLVSSVSTARELITTPVHFWPQSITLANYGSMFQFQQGGNGFRFLYAMRNSVITSSITTFITLAVGGLAGYVLARYEFRGKNGVILGFLASNLMPTIALVIPFYVIIVGVLSRYVHLYNSNVLLILLYLSFIFGFVVWVMKGYYEGIPLELEEAARIDGTSRLGAFLRITLPLARPGLVATGLLSFLMAWDNFLLPLIFTRNHHAYNLPYYIFAMIGGEYRVYYNQVAAAGVLVAIIPVFIASVFTKYIVSGMTSGSIK